MTNNQKEKLSNSKIFGMLVVVASVLVIAAVAVPSQNAMATVYGADVNVDEAVEAGNATTMMADNGMNQTMTSNITGNNSTS